MPLKLFRANANIGSVKSLHTLLIRIWTINMQGKFEPNRLIQNVQNLSFWTQN